MIDVFISNRIGRLPYLLWSLVIGVLLLPVGKFLNCEDPSVRVLGGLLIAAAGMLPSVMRLHDLNKSGWLWLLGLIPLVNIFFGIYLLFGKGTDGANDYGDPPEDILKKLRSGSLSMGSRSSGRACGGEAAKEIETNSIIVSRSDNNEFYDEVAKEIETNKLVPGVWTRAFAEADGNENRAKAIYIKRRVAQLAEGSRRWSELEVIQMGGDTKAVSWEVVNDRWVKNTYANDDVTMSDKDTGGMWIFNADLCGKKKWGDAVKYCDNLIYAGYSDWRLPDKDELETQFSQKGHFAGVQRDCWSGMSSSTSDAWYVNMVNGYVGNYNKSSHRYVWPVRGGK